MHYFLQKFVFEKNNIIFFSTDIFTEGYWGTDGIGLVDQL